MPSDRRLSVIEQARRESYDHSAPKDSNFNPLSQAAENARTMAAVTTNRSVMKPGAMDDYRRPRGKTDMLNEIRRASVMQQEED